MFNSNNKQQGTTSRQRPLILPCHHPSLCFYTSLPVPGCGVPDGGRALPAADNAVPVLAHFAPQIPMYLPSTPRSKVPRAGATPRHQSGSNGGSVLARLVCCPPLSLSTNITAHPPIFPYECLRLISPEPRIARPTRYPSSCADRLDNVGPGPSASRVRRRRTTRQRLHDPRTWRPEDRVATGNMLGSAEESPCIP